MVNLFFHNPILVPTLKVFLISHFRSGLVFLILLSVMVDEPSYGTTSPGNIISMVENGLMPPRFPERPYPAFRLNWLMADTSFKKCSFLMFQEAESDGKNPQV